MMTMLASYAYTPQGLPTKHHEKFTELSSLCIPLNNYKVYREELKQKGVEQCCLPALVCYLKDLTFIEGSCICC